VLRPIFQVEGPKFLKGPKSGSFSYTKRPHTKVQKTCKSQSTSCQSETLVTTPGWVCHKLENPVEFPDQFQFSPYQHRLRSSLQLPTSTIAFALPKGSFSRLPHASRFCIPGSCFCIPDSQVFCSSCGNILCTVFFGVLLWLGCLVVCFLHVFAEDAAPAAARLRARDLLIVIC